MLSPISTTYSSSSSSSSRSVKPRMMISLPVELFYNVLSRLPTILLLKLRSVCTLWRDIIDDPHFATMQATSGIKTTRILLIPGPEKRADRFADSQFAVDDEFIRALIPEFSVKSGLYKARASCHGLLCFEDRGVTCLFNPLAREMVSLTSVEKSRLERTFTDRYLIGIGIGVDRLTCRYKIVRVSYFCNIPDEPRTGRSREESSRAEVLDQGSRSWRDIGPPPSSLILRDAVFAAGSIHWNSEGRDGIIRISSFDVAKEKFAWTPCPKLQKEKAHLVDLEGVLGLVDWSCMESINVWVMEESGQWMKEYSVCFPLPVGSGYRFDVLGCGGRKIALNRQMAPGFLESSWTFYDSGTELKHVQEVNRPLARTVASITLSLLSPAKLWNSGLEEIRRY